MRTKQKKKVKTLKGYMVVEPPNDTLVPFSFSKRKNFAELNYERFIKANWLGSFLLPGEKLKSVRVTITITERKRGK